MTSADSAAPVQLRLWPPEDSTVTERAPTGEGPSGPDAAGDDALRRARERARRPTPARQLLGAFLPPAAADDVAAQVDPHDLPAAIAALRRRVAVDADVLSEVLLLDLGLDADEASRLGGGTPSVVRFEQAFGTRVVQPQLPSRPRRQPPPAPRAGGPDRAPTVGTERRSTAQDERVGPSDQSSRLRRAAVTAVLAAGVGLGVAMAVRAPSAPESMAGTAEQRPGMVVTDARMTTSTGGSATPDAVSRLRRAGPARLWFRIDRLEGLDGPVELVVRWSRPAADDVEQRVTVPADTSIVDVPLSSRLRQRTGTYSVTVLHDDRPIVEEQFFVVG